MRFPSAALLPLSDKLVSVSLFLMIEFEFPWAKPFVVLAVLPIFTLIICFDLFIPQTHLHSFLSEV